LRIGPFVLAGAYGPAELGTWVERASSDEGRAAYLSDQLAAGELDKVTTLSGENPAMLNPLYNLAADLETPFAVRIGVGAVLEALGPDGQLRDQVEAIDRALGHSKHSQIRADAAHFLGLTGTAAARSALERLANDPDASVREIAVESLEQLP
jgi:HEAT repeat protein